MAQVKITLPDGVEVDRIRLTSAIRFALQGTDPVKIWRLNNVPAIAQLEEAVYDEGMQDLATLYDEVITGLDLPPDLQAQAVIQKALCAREQPLLPPDTAAEVLADLRKAFGFREDQHPRSGAGEETAGYLPGEFVPKGAGGGTASEATSDPIQAYQKRHSETGAGFDNRQAPSRGDTGSWNRRWPAGREMSARECDAKGLPPGTKDYSPEEHDAYRNMERLGEGFYMVGPQDDPHLRHEAMQMKARIEGRFPEWVRQRLQEKGVNVLFTAASPLRAMFGSQDEYYQWVRKTPALANQMGPDTSPGVFMRKRNMVLAHIGFSSPVPGINMGAVNLEGHEYAHAVDANLREDGAPVSETPEWQEIVAEMAPHLDQYSAKPDELFAEGLNCYLESPQLRKQMKDGPPAWKKMAAFFSDLMGESTAGHAKKAVRSAVTRSDPQPFNLPQGFVWRSLSLPQTDGETLQLDGWGPAQQQ